MANGRTGECSNAPASSPFAIRQFAIRRSVFCKYAPTPHEDGLLYSPVRRAPDRRKDEGHGFTGGGAILGERQTAHGEMANGEWTKAEGRHFACSPETPTLRKK